MYREALASSYLTSLRLDGGTGVKQEELRDANGKLSEAAVAQAEKNLAKKLESKYSKYLGDLKEGHVKNLTIAAMDNYVRATKYLTEATMSTAIANFDKYALPLIRAVLPEIQTPRLFSTQMMYGPTSMIFTFENLYGTTRGAVTAGQRMFENHEPNYGDSQIDVETLATGNGATVQFTGFLQHPPIVPGSVTIVAATAGGADMNISDDGAGGLVGDTGATNPLASASPNSINYETGAITVEFSTAPGAANSLEISYSVNSEGNEGGIPELEVGLTSQLLVARSKKFRMRWSLESSFAMRDTVGLDTEAELLTEAAAEMGYGIDSVNVDNVKRVAMDKRNDTDFQFDRTPGAGISFTEHKHEITDTLILGSSYILGQSGRAVGNWVLGGENFTNVIESLAPRFKSTGKVPATRGILYLGTLDGRWEIFKDMRMDANEWLMGYKADSFMHAGYVWAPWIAAFSTPTTVLDDFNGRKGIGSLYGQKIINNKFYLRGKVIKS